MPVADPDLDAETRAAQRFDLGQYLARSKQLDLSGIDFDAVREHPVSREEIGCLVYMMDIEAHTLCYLRDVLNAGAGAEPEIADFLGCWLYEEAYHGRAIERFLRAAGVDRPADVCGRHRPTLLERLEALGTFLLSRLTPGHFLTTYMAWGAIQEHSTLFGYTNLARKTRNPVLAELLRRIARDESRHFGFYYYKAQQRLKASRSAQIITSALLRAFWTPVGEGVKPRHETDSLITFIFDGPEGRDAFERIDRTMSRLPGLGWFDMMGRRMAAARTRLGTSGAPA